MISMGVNFAHDRGAALVRDGEVVCAISLERLDRKKHSSGVTLAREAVDYCLAKAGCSRAEVDVLVYNYPHHGKAYPVAGNIRAELGRLFKRTVFVPHHLAHGYSSFYASPFNEAVVLVVDGAGNKMVGQTLDFYKEWEWDFPDISPRVIEAESAWYFSEGGTKKELLFKRWQTRDGKTSRQVFGLGRMYWTACLHVGMGILDGGKLMGLAPYGEALRPDPPAVIQRGPVVPTGPYRFPFTINPGAITQLPTGTFDERAVVAWTTQYALEELLVWLTGNLHSQQPCLNICIAGGVGLNSVSNNRILRETPFQNVFVTPASDDSGIALGCAFFGYHQILGGRKRAPYNVYSGRNYSNAEMQSALSGYAYRKSDDVIGEVARLLAGQKIVGWFQGASEYGPRALGHRSILCDPRQAKMKDTLNEKVKHREWYRPFAPVVPAEKAPIYFDADYECPYMLKVVDTREEVKSFIPAVVHVDGTARVQTVTAQQNPKLHKLLLEFEALSGIHVLLNTSFNVAGEPIVETPDDALRCFLNTEIDVLVIGDYILDKSDIDWSV